MTFSTRRSHSIERISAIGEFGVDLLLIPSVCAGLLVRKVYCGKTVDWIWIPFGVVSGIGRGMGVLDRRSDRRRARGSFGY